MILRHGNTLLLLVIAVVVHTIITLSSIILSSYVLCRSEEVGIKLISCWFCSFETPELDFLKKLQICSQFSLKLNAQLLNDIQRNIWNKLEIGDCSIIWLKNLFIYFSHRTNWKCADIPYQRQFWNTKSKAEQNQLHCPLTRWFV